MLLIASATYNLHILRICICKQSKSCKGHFFICTFALYEPLLSAFLKLYFRHRHQSVIQRAYPGTDNISSVFCKTCVPPGRSTRFFVTSTVTIYFFLSQKLKDWALHVSLNTSTQRIYKTSPCIFTWKIYCRCFAFYSHKFIAFSYFSFKIRTAHHFCHFTHPLVYQNLFQSSCIRAQFSHRTCL